LLFFFGGRKKKNFFFCESFDIMVMDFSVGIDIEIENRAAGMPSSRDLSYELATIMIDIEREEGKRRFEASDIPLCAYPDYESQFPRLENIWHENEEKGTFCLISPQERSLRTVIAAGKKLSAKHVNLTLLFHLNRTGEDQERRWFRNGEHIAKQELQISYSWGPRCSEGSDSD
jgi:hypothetical protein